MAYFDDHPNLAQNLLDTIFHFQEVLLLHKPQLTYNINSLLKVTALALKTILQFLSPIQVKNFTNPSLNIIKC